VGWQSGSDVFFLQIYHPSVTEIGHFASPDFCFHSRKPDIGLLVESPGHPGMVLGLPPKPPPESHHLTIGQLRTTQPAPISRKSQVKIRVDHRVEHHWNTIEDIIVGWLYDVFS